MSVHGLNEADTGAAKQYFFDANVWLDLFPGTSTRVSKWATDYSDFLARIQRDGGTIIFNVLVLSEYVNRLCRTEHEVYQKLAKKEIKYKDYRRLSQFKDVSRAAADSAAEIMQLSVLQKEGVFDSDIDIEKCLATFASGDSDINDLFFADICVKNGWSFVTSDFDFISEVSRLEIFSANKDFVRAASRNVHRMRNP